MKYIYKSTEAEHRVQAWCEQRIESWSHPHQRETRETKAGRTHLLSAGSDGPTVVFLPGTNFCAASMLDEIEFLARTSRVIVPDIPGQPGLSHPFRIDSAPLFFLGAWLSELLGELATPVVVVGHSLGGGIALAADSPHIAGRVLISPAGLVRLRVPMALVWASLRWMLSPNTVTTRTLLAHMSAPGAAVDEVLISWMTLVGANSHTSLAPHALPRDVLEHVVGTPIQIAAGRYDPFLPPEHLRREGVGLPPAMAVPDVGHLLTTATTRLVAAWVGGLTP
ncbi:alpha/beta fold hydrolase [Occultella glacieicola]|uniref:Alpha/beta fold hydrolase n=1 Tax=Occultella glacieicola TaxID=2518684 RepID=A0ABY2DZD1_9MICO|nr:alpha/beta fold hydrolase [Occultella glacieicola]TDE90052.1 alpha/beta fold hydrolase [Occultella glacieicola]